MSLGYMGRSRGVVLDSVIEPVHQLVEEPLATHCLEHCQRCLHRLAHRPLQVHARHMTLALPGVSVLWTGSGGFVPLAHTSKRTASHRAGPTRCRSRLRGPSRYGHSPRQARPVDECRYRRWL